MSVTGKNPTCHDSRECFAAMPCQGGFRKCRILTNSYEEDGDCPFCKPDVEVTNGQRYPYDTKYGKEG